MTDEHGDDGPTYVYLTSDMTFVRDALRDLRRNIESIHEGIDAIADGRALPMQGNDRVRCLEPWKTRLFVERRAEIARWLASVREIEAGARALATDLGEEWD